jgi:hypothetical protein
MAEFFKGWRRKLGIATLILACVFMAGWVRSQFTFDDLDIAFGDPFVDMAYTVRSTCNGIEFMRVSGLPPAGEWSGLSNLAALDENRNTKYVSPRPAQQETVRRWDWAGFHFVDRRRMNWRHDEYMIPYWSIVIPLTLISAFLLLTKPRKLTQKKTTEPIGNEGA